MDLSRWNIPHLSKIRNDFREFRDFLGDVLDGERELLKDPKLADTKPAAFAVSDDWAAFENDLAALKPGLAAEKILSAFAPYFEGALCLRMSASQTRLTGLVLFGQSFTPPDSKGSLIDFKLGRIEEGSVIRGRIQPILNSLRLEMLGQLHEAEAFAFSPSEGVVYVLFCSRPHPWQVFAIETAYQSALQACRRTATEPRSTGRQVVDRARGMFK